MILINKQKRRARELSGRKDMFLQVLQDPRSMFIIIDPEEASWREAVKAVEDYARKNHIRYKIVYIDQREDRKLPLPVLSSDVVSEDSFRPDGKPLAPICEGLYDVLISLARGSSYPMEYLVAKTEAKVRIGRQELEHTVFDIMVSAPDESAAEHPQTQEEAFAAILSYMSRLICKR